MGKGTRRPRGKNRVGRCTLHKKWLTTIVKCGKEYSCKGCKHFKAVKKL